LKPRPHAFRLQVANRLEPADCRDSLTGDVNLDAMLETSTPSARPSWAAS
jgi:hypothetical protein